MEIHTSSTSHQPGLRQRYAFVGTGARFGTFVHALCRDHGEAGKPVALLDSSPTRYSAWNRDLVEEYGITPLPCYQPGQWEQLLCETRPDVIVITSVDSTHHEYIIKALDAGCDVVTEKPMTTDAEKCLQIFEAVERNNGKNHIRVTFNYRWSSYNSKVKEVLSSGAIGNILTVNMEYLLDTRHGADYFRRWHSEMNQSGGLLVHKSTHHFDLVNWWIDSIPESVYAFGDLVFYGSHNAVRRGDERYTRYPRYTGYTSQKDDPFALPLSGKDMGSLFNYPLEKLYFKAEQDSGYIRDRNVFRDGIDIFDAMSALVRYRNGVTLNYSLNAYSPREGMRVTFNGDRGRIEYYEMGGSHIVAGQVDEQLAAEQAASQKHEEIIVYPHFKAAYPVPVEREVGSHGGADPKLQRAIFGRGAGPDPLGRDAGHEQGAASILTGICANRSIASGLPVLVSELLSLRPDTSRLSALI